MEAGQHIRDFILEEKIGAGGVGEVWRARHQHLNNAVAIKAIYRHASQDAQFHKRFLEEARVMAGLDHPHIVGVHDFFVLDGVSYLVMAYIAGGSLDHLLKQRGHLPLDEVLDISRGILDALNFAHSQGVIHRDVKPSNILVRSDRHAYLADFGIALVVGRPRVTRFGTNIGTPEYMSPEQIQARHIDHRTDVYSFGCVLYEMLTGGSPFGSQEGKSEYEIMSGHLHAQPPSLREINGEVDAHTESVILRAMAKNPDDRYGGCQDLANALYARNAPAPQAIPVIADHEQVTGNVAEVLNRPQRWWKTWTIYMTIALLVIVLLPVSFAIRYATHSQLNAEKIPQSETSKNAEVEQALDWLRMATTRGLYIADALKRLPPFLNALEIAKSSGVSASTIDEMQKNLDRQLKTIDATLQEYAQSISQLYKLENDSREKAFSQYVENLTRTQETAHLQILTKAVKKHLQQYPDWVEGDVVQWKTDFEQL